jgi:uncharacterized membrane protein (DUF106 family)
MHRRLEKGINMFFEMLFGYVISFILGALVLAAIIAFNVLIGNLYIARTVDIEKRKADKQQKKREKKEKREKEEKETEKTE